MSQITKVLVTESSGSFLQLKARKKKHAKTTSPIAFGGTYLVVYSLDMSTFLRMNHSSLDDSIGFS